MNNSPNNRLFVRAGFSTANTIHTASMKPLVFGNTSSTTYTVFQKVNILNKDTFQALCKYLVSDEFKPLQQVVPVFIVGMTKAVLIDPLVGGFRLMKDFSGFGAVGKKVKKWIEKTGEDRVRHVLPSIKLEPEPMKIN